jgi:CheY-like chemotaxis protein
VLSRSRVETDPARIIEDVASMMGARAEGKGVNLHVAYDGSVPSAIATDPTRLRQILLNLTGNAVKFTEAGDVTLRVSCDADTRLFRVRVEDTGIGMSPEELTQITRFERFGQGDGSTTRRFGGTGLGLRISHSLARMLGGDIDVESEIGAGSAFTLTIDTGDLAGVAMRTPSNDFATESADPPRTGAANDARLAGVRVLLVEDGPDNQRLITLYLEKAGATVETAENGRIALERMRAASPDERPDVILMDMHMPEMDGYSAARALRREGHRLPIVALTAHAMDGDGDKCLHAGCDDYLTKPIDRAALIERCALWAASDPASRAA